MENKNKRFEIRLTEKQDKMLREQAAKAGLEVSEYARRKIFKGEKGIIDSIKFLEEYMQYIHEIRKIGTNINQVAHYANILKNNDMLSTDVIKEMTVELSHLTTVEQKIEELYKRILNS